MAKDTSRTARPRAETPKGFRDYFGAEVRARSAMLARITEVYHAWGFDPLETSAVETVEALGKFLPDVDRPNQGVFAWQDEDATWLALRYDLTAPLARVFAQHRRDLPSPYRRYAVGPVWRDEKPGPGRFRQFYQCDADTVGAGSVAADAEMCMMLADALIAAGIDRSDFLIRVNSRKVLNGVLERAGLYDPSAPEVFAKERGIVLRAIDKLDRLGVGGVGALLGEGRRDESGDFTKGAGLGNLQTEAVLDYVGAFARVQDKLSRQASLGRQTGVVDADIYDRARDSVYPSFLQHYDSYGRFRHIWSRAMLDHLTGTIGDSSEGFAGVEDLRRIFDLVHDRGYSDVIVIEPSVVRGLGYYTGPVFEAELTFEILDEKGNRRQFGSVAGGGRYDDLVRRFTGETVPATGISIGVDRLLAALAARSAAAAVEAGPVVVTVMDRDRMADYQALAAELRGAGIRAEVFLGGGGMGRQLKYADQRGSPVAVIEGGDERARGVVQLKDLALGARLAAEVATHAAWRAQPAQVEVPRAQLAAGVRAMLARAGG